MRRSLPSLLLFALVALSILTACGSPVPAAATPTALVGAAATPATATPTSVPPATATAAATATSVATGTPARVATPATAAGTPVAGCTTAPAFRDEPELAKQVRVQLHSRGRGAQLSTVAVHLRGTDRTCPDGVTFVPQARQFVFADAATPIAGPEDAGQWLRNVLWALQSWSRWYQAGPNARVVATYQGPAGPETVAFAFGDGLTAVGRDLSATALLAALGGATARADALGTPSAAAPTTYARTDPWYQSRRCTYAQTGPFSSQDYDGLRRSLLVNAGLPNATIAGELRRDEFRCDDGLRGELYTEETFTVTLPVADRADRQMLGGQVARVMPILDIDITIPETTIVVVFMDGQGGKETITCPLVTWNEARRQKLTGAALLDALQRPR